MFVTLPAIAALAIMGCTRKHGPAPVEVYHGSPGQQAYQLDLPENSISPYANHRNQIEATAAPVVAEKTVGTETPLYVIARPRDTVHTLETRYGVPASKIIMLNNLPSPYRLKAGQKVYLRQPNESKPTNILAANGEKPFIWPINGRVVAKYGNTNGIKNEGVNIAAPRNTPIHAAADGKVAYVGNHLEEFGNLALIAHKDGMRTAYAHAQRLVVKPGQDIKAGQLIGYVGDTGKVTFPQLHFEVRKGEQSLNPVDWTRQG